MLPACEVPPSRTIKLMNPCHVTSQPDSAAAGQGGESRTAGPGLSLRVFPLLITALLAASAAANERLDLSAAVIVTASDPSGPEHKAVQMLVEEVEKRTRLRLPVLRSWPASNAAVIAVLQRSALTQISGDHAATLLAERKVIGPEGYRLWVKRGAANPAVFVCGEDARGVLFGVGRLLRELRQQPGGLSVAARLDVSTAPKYPLRGHQLGYRPKTHSYDAWDLPVWEQYYRDLAVFGCNAVELIPPRSDDDADSPHFPRPPMEMMIGMSRLANDYGLDVWVWYPAMDEDYSDPKTVEFALREWGEVFSRLPRLDAVFVPGGDPGHTQPRHLMALLEKQAANLRRHHPKAQMWVSPQGFDQTWFEEFIGILKRDQPSWLTGLVHGPQVRVSLPRLREVAPPQYPIRQYPDITHSRQCQYPVPEWDVAFSATEGRECINPRPLDQAVIFRHTQPGTIGFLTYSEGCNDDVNKTIWSALGWNPETRVLDILRDYSRYFIGESYGDDFAQGLLALERNWRGPLLVNAGVETTLAQFQAMERAASPAVLRNWRFQQALFRAYYDAYIRQRLIWETALESQAMEQLRGAAAGTLIALAAAERMLDRVEQESVQTDWRQRIHELAEALFQSISMQLSVTKYRAIAVDRGASLDTLDVPLNNRLWLKQRFAEIRKLGSEADRLRAIEQIVNWTNPGPGGFYDDLGNLARQPHLMPGLSFEADPGRMQSARVSFAHGPVVEEQNPAVAHPRRVSWMDHAEPLYDTPLTMRYDGLDPTALYEVRVVYAGDNFRRKIRLLANDTLEIHPYLGRPVPIRPLEFTIPAEATRQGELKLTWFGEPALGGNGRNCQVSEVWLIKKSAPVSQ